MKAKPAAKPRKAKPTTSAPSAPSAPPRESSGAPVITLPLLGKRLDARQQARVLRGQALDQRVIALMSLAEDQYLEALNSLLDERTWADDKLTLAAYRAGSAANAQDYLVGALERINSKEEGGGRKEE